MLDVEAMTSIARTTSPRSFALGVGVGLIPAITFAALSLAFFRNVDERTPHDRIVADQLRNDGIYSSGLGDDFYAYKMALYRAVKPRIVAIGSSRVWGFQQRGFRDSFATLGGPVSSLTEAAEFIDDMKRAGPMPEIVLLGLDYWWFNADWDPDAPTTSAWTDDKRDLESWLGLSFRPAMWLASRKISIGEFVAVATSGAQLAPPLPPAYGVLARFDWIGFAPDGHYRYFGYAFGRMRGDAQLATSAQHVHQGTGRYVFGEHVSRARVEQLRALIAELEAAGSQVITILPPLSSVVIAANQREGTKLAYIAETRDELRRTGLARYDFEDASQLGATDCEFVDGYHGGEVVYLRILAAIASDATSALGPHVDLPLVRAMIDHGRGHILADFDAFAPYHELDFLGLGCAK